MTTELYERLLEGLPTNLRAKALARGILKDPQVQKLLEPLTLDARHQVLRQVVNLGVPLPDAMKAVAPEEPEEHRLEEVGDPPADAKNPNRFVQRWRTDALKPNAFNHSLFEESLSEESIRQLADTMDYQRVPIEITDEGLIVDGERRWRAANLLGWESVDVIVVGNLTDQEIKDRVLDSFSSTRNASLAEKARLYAALREQLQRRHGRTPGRPEKQMPNGIIYEPAQIEDMAAKKAGLPSARTAKRLAAVFERADRDTIEQVTSGSMSISRAYESLPKREKKGAGKDTQTSSYDDNSEDPDVGDDNDGEQPAMSEEEAGGLESGKSDTATHIEAEDDETDQSDADGPVEGFEEEGALGSPSEELAAAEDVDHPEEIDGDDHADLSEEGAGVDEALEVLALHLADLVAEGGLKPAKAELQSWITWLFERAKGARNQAA